MSLVERASSTRVESIEVIAKAVMPSAKLHHVQPFPGLFCGFFFFAIESEILELASQKIATDKPNNN